MTWSTPWPKIGLCGAPMMADEMQPDDQSFTDLLEVCSQNLDKRTRTTISNGAANPGRGRAPRSNYSSDKSFMFFMQCGRGSIMPSMLLTKAKEWNSCKQNGDASTPLRITMFLHCFQELAHRAKQLQLEAKDDALVTLKGHLSRGQQMGLSHLGYTGPTAEGQQDATSDVRGTPHTSWNGLRILVNNNR